MWTLAYEGGARRDIRHIRDARLKARIEKALLSLRDDPRGPGALKVQGYDRTWRVRVGDWRICYRIEDDRLLVLVITAAPRGEVYELLQRRAGR